MLYLSLIIIATSLAFTMPLTFTPLILGLWVLTMAIFLAALIAITCSSWFGLILFIIYVGGMLVMFSYFAAISPNQQVPISLILTALASTAVLMFSSMYKFNTFLQFSSVAPQNSPSILYFFYAPHMTPILIMLAGLLLLALILVVKIAKRSEGPLRPFN